MVLSSVNTNNIASLNACFSASAAASYRLVSFDGVELVCQDISYYYYHSYRTIKAKERQISNK